MSYKALIEELAQGKIVFDLEVHGNNNDLLSEMASGIYPHFKIMPLECLTTDLIDSASQTLCNMWGLEDCFVKGNYEETSISLVKNGVNLHSFHPDLLTRKMIEACLEVELWDTFNKKVNSLGPKINQWFDSDILNSAISKRLDLISLLNESEIALLHDDALRDGLRQRPMNGTFLERMGRTDIITREVGNGWWINDGNHDSPKDDSIYGRPRPASIKDAVSIRMKMKPGDPDILFFDCYVSSFPLASVMPFIKTKPREDWVMRLFPTDDLIKAFNGNNRMKGRLLELDLGM